MTPIEKQILYGRALNTLFPRDFATEIKAHLDIYEWVACAKWPHSIITHLYDSTFVSCTLFKMELWVETTCIRTLANYPAHGDDGLTMFQLSDDSILIYGCYSQTKIQNLAAGGQITYIKDSRILLATNLTDSRIAIHYADGPIEIWDSTMQILHHHLENHPAGHYYIVQMGDIIITSRQREAITRVYDSTTGKFLRIFHGRFLLLGIDHEHPIQDVVIIDKGKGKIWNPTTDKMVPLLGNVDNATRFAPLKNGTIVTYGYGYDIFMWDRRSGRLLKTLHDGEDWTEEDSNPLVIRILQISDGSIVAYYSNHLIKTWNPNTGELLKVIYTGGLANVYDLELLKDGRIMMNDTCGVTIWK